MRRCSVRMILAIAVMMSLLVGCKDKSEAANEGGKQVGSMTVYDAPIEVEFAVQEETTISVQLTVINTCGVDIGMFALIDPATKEQLNIASIANQSAITIGANWPKEENMLYWALYNDKGELCIEGSSDITGIKEAATIILNGDGNVTDVQVNVQ